jgi:hypothetical protein
MFTFPNLGRVRSGEGSMRRYYRVSLAIILLTGLVLTQNSAQADTLTSYPRIASTQYSAQELQQRGCVVVTITQTGENELQWEYPAGHDSSFLQAKDPGTGKIYQGKNSNGSTTSVRWFENTFSCPVATYNNVIASNTSAEGSSWSWLAAIVGWIVNTIFDIVDAIITWMIGWLTSTLFLTLLQQGVFIQSDVVKAGWPFIQGITNLGFIFALLYIALATTLRLESVSTSIQRLLPKLLIGALLINFSLVIGGLIIDASRLAMAIELRFIGGEDANSGNLIATILSKSKTYETAGASLLGGTALAPGLAGILLTRIQTTAVNLALSLGLAIIALNLFVRYVVLLILLIFSPVAYLAIVLPQTSKFFYQWWGMFIKWVLYGPIVLFFLIIITKINSIGLPEGAGIFPQIAQFCVVVALLYSGHVMGKKIAGVGAEGAMGFVKKHPRTTAAVAGSVLTGGLGGAALGLLGLGAARTGARNANDFYQDTKSNITKRARGNELFGKGTWASSAAKFVAGPERDKDRKLKAGESSYGSRLADRLPVSISTEGRAAINAVNTAAVPNITIPTTIEEKEEFKKTEAKEAGSIKKLQEAKELLPAKLMKKSTATALSKEQIDTIMKHGTVGQKEALVSHKEVVKKMSDDVKGAITTGLLENTDGLKKKIDSRLRDLSNKE